MKSSQHIVNESDLLSEETLETLEIPCEGPIQVSWKGSLPDYFSNLFEIDKFYKPDPKIFSLNNNINSYMRAILLDWIIEVSTMFNLKRETYYIALSTLDRYLSIEKVEKSELQLIGVVCLYISCKKEEISTPRIADFVKTTDNAFTVQDFLQSENKILCKLKWHLCPVTFYNWLNAMLEEWDKYILYVFSDLINNSGIDKDHLNRVLITFKQKNKHSYERFNECIELLDVCTLDFSIYQFFSARVISSIVYLMVNRAFLKTNYEILPRREDSIEDFEYSVVVDNLIQQFLVSTVGIFSIETLIPSMRFVESFRNFPFQSNSSRFGFAESFVRII